MGETDGPPEMWLTALAGLPSMGPVRLLALHRAYGAAGAWQHVLCGDVLQLEQLDGRLGRDPVGLARRWAREAAQVDVEGRWRAHLEAGIQVVALGSPGYPAVLAADIEPPAVIFLQGDVGALDAPRVAVVGTRGCTRVGRELAFELGRGLAGAGVCVVSGLALGIDGASHQGALAPGAEGTAAAPVAVVANGLDIVYPKRHAELQHRVARGGLLLSEAAVGTRPEAWRFPARNRIIAGLSDAVVVVESRITGGSMHTADEALERGITVLAVPGNVRSPASAGTNHLLAAGASIARDLDDILATIGLGGQRGGGGHPRLREQRPPPEGKAQHQVLDAMGWEPVTFEQLVARTGLELGALAGLLVELEAGGWVRRSGGWLEQATTPHG